MRRLMLPDRSRHWLPADHDAADGESPCVRESPAISGGLPVPVAGRDRATGDAGGQQAGRSGQVHRVERNHGIHHGPTFDSFRSTPSTGAVTSGGLSTSASACQVPTKSWPTRSNWAIACPTERELCRCGSSRRSAVCRICAPSGPVCAQSWWRCRRTPRSTGDGIDPKHFGGVHQHREFHP